MLANSARVASASWRVLRQDRELLLFPLMALAAHALIVAATVLAATEIGGARLEVGRTTTVEMTADAWAVYGLGTLAVGCVSVFFGGALAAGAFQRMAGGDPTVSSALWHAVERLPALMGWAGLTWTVGMAMRVAGSKVGWLGRMLLGGADALWSIAVYLTVPAIVVDDLGPVRALRQSVRLLRSTWGENLVARAGLGVVAAALMIPAAPVTALLAASDSPVLAVGAPVVLMVWLVAVTVALTTLNAIYQTALYLYATGGGSSATGFDEDVLAGSFATGGGGSTRPGFQ